MPNIKLPYFGILDSNSLAEYYDTETDFTGNQLQIDINFSNKTIECNRLEIVKHFLENIRIHDINNKKHLQNNFDDENADTVRTYIENHLDELPTDDLDRLVGANTRISDQPKQLVKKLHLVRLGLYPDSREQFAIFDYSVGKDLTKHVVAINTDENGNLSVRYNDLMAPIIKSIQELQEILVIQNQHANDLESQIELLKENQKKLETRLNQLESK